MTPSIGIDFGTTKTLVAYPSEQGRKPEIAHLGRERNSIPTTAFYGEGGIWEFGDDADDYACDTTLADHYVGRFKLKLGSMRPLLQIFNDESFSSFTALDVTAEYLRYVRETCEKEVFNGHAVTEAVITHPIHFTPAQLADLRRAAELAGFSIVKLMREPEAAGLVFCRICPKDVFNGTALVVDWGGGTLDLALVSREEGSVRIHEKYVAGADTIGGVVFDELLWRYVAERLQQEHGVTLAEDSIDHIRLQKKKVCAAKEKLSHSETATLSLVGNQGAYPTLKLSREEVEKTLQPYVQAGLEAMQDLLNRIQEQSLRPTQVLLIGGSCQIPLIGKLIQEKTGLPCRKWQYSHEAVAMGAALGLGLAESSIQDSDAHEEPKKPTATAEPIQHETEASEISEAEKEFRLATQCRLGWGTQQDVQKALKHYRNAAKLGHVAAQTYMGWCYENGFGVERNEFQAMEWYRQAAQNGEETAQMRLGKNLLRRNKTSEALTLLQESAQKGCSEALFILGLCYQEGKGVSRNIGKAVDYYQQGADLQHGKARCNLGYCCEKLIKGEKDKHKAVQMYSEAAEQGDPMAQYNLSRCYSRGIEVYKDKQAAKRWRKLSRESKFSPPSNFGYSFKLFLPWIWGVAAAVVCLIAFYCIACMNAVIENRISNFKEYSGHFEWSESQKKYVRIGGHSPTSQDIQAIRESEHRYAVDHTLAYSIITFILSSILLLITAKMHSKMATHSYTLKSILKSVDPDLSEGQGAPPLPFSPTRH